MWEMTNGAAREKLTARAQVDQDTLEQLRRSGTLVVDERRRRPLYFDGRFLTARDLTREQQYFLARQADLGRAGGTGVVHGLMVTSNGGTSLTIGAGHGVTVGGETVILPKALTVQLSNLAEVQRLDVSFGLSRRPSPPPRSRSGLYVLALRAVEFSANPIASYPTSVTDPRTVEDGEIVEAAVATLIPYPDDGARSDTGMRRARAAREIFVEGATRGLPVDALPLAMVLLDQGVVRWVDVFLVRREVGSSHGDVLGLGYAPRAVREAHLVQYDHHLADVMRDRAQANRGARFAASEHFVALPPGGRLPAAAINPRDFTQSYFPPEVDVDLSIVPEDEVAALLEESVLLPPIDLTASGDTLESTAVTVLLPVPRQHMRLVRNVLARAEQQNLTRELRTAAPGLVAQRRPLEALAGLRLARLGMPVAPVQDNLVDTAWAEALSGAAQAGGGLLWYARRRNLQYRSDLVGTSLRVVADEFPDELRLEQRLTEGGILAAYRRLQAAASSAAFAEVTAFLSSRKITGSRLLLNVVVRELTLKLEPVQPPVQPPPPPLPPVQPPLHPPPLPPLPAGLRTHLLRLAKVAALTERYADAAFGDGFAVLDPDVIARAAAAGTTLDAIAAPIAGIGAAPEIERIGDRMRGEENATDRQKFAKDLVSAAAGANPGAAVRTLVDATLQGTSP
jgi:hypothetical protein